MGQSRFFCVYRLLLNVMFVWFIYVVLALNTYFLINSLVEDKIFWFLGTMLLWIITCIYTCGVAGSQSMCTFSFNRYWQIVFKVLASIYTLTGIVWKLEYSISLPTLGCQSFKRVLICLSLMTNNNETFLYVYWPFG